MNYKERLLIELEELTIKIEKLKRYIEENKITSYTDLEENQLSAMEVYKHWLEQRILKLMD